MRLFRIRSIAFVVVLWAFAPGGALAHTSAAAASVSADFNRDGFADLAIGVHDETVSGFFKAGAVNVLYGSAGGLRESGDQFWHQDSPGVEDVAEPDDEFGAALAAGDFNGDGYQDLAIGVRSEDVNGQANAGAVNVLYGSSSGLRAAGDQFWHQDSPGVNDTAEADDGFGSALATGDFGKSGRADLAIGVPGENIDVRADAGAVNVLYGSSTRLTAEGDQFWHQDSPGVNDAAEADDGFGTALAAADYGQSSRADLAIGVVREDVDLIGNAGAVNVLFGSSTGLTAAGDEFWHQDSPGVEDQAEPGDNFGSSLAGADFGKSAGADLAVGVPGEDVDTIADAGAVNVLYGSADDDDNGDNGDNGDNNGDDNGDDNGLTAAGDQFWHQDSPGVEDAAELGDLFATALAAADFGKSTRADLAVGVGHEDIDLVAGNAGAVNVLYGSSTGLTAVGNQFWHQNSPDVEDDAEPGDSLGFGLTGLNFGKGSRADLGIGVSQEDVDTIFDAGAVNVLYGSANGLTAAGDQFWHQNSPGIDDEAEASDELGLALAARSYGNRPTEPF